MQDVLIRGRRSKDEDESKKISRQEDEQHPGVPHDDHRTRAKGADGGAFQPNVVAKQVLQYGAEAVNVERSEMRLKARLSGRKIRPSPIKIYTTCGLSEAISKQRSSTNSSRSQVEERSSL